MTYSSTALVVFLSHLLTVAMCQSSMCPNTTKDTFYIDVFDHLLLNEPQTVSNLRGAPFIQGMDRSQPAYDFTGLGTGFSVAGLSDTLREASCAHNEVTFLGRVFIQDSQSDGPLLELSYGAGLEMGLVVYMLHLDAAADEIRLGYRHSGRLHSENIPIRLIGGRWRNYAISLSGNLLTLYFDCNLVTQRLVPLPDYCSNDSSIVLSVAGSINGGTEFTGRTGLHVFLQKVGIHFGPGGVRTQCPETPALCPSCGQFLSVLEQLTFAHEEILRLQGIIDNGTFTCPTDPPTTPAPTLSTTNCIVEERGQRQTIPNRGFLLFSSSNQVCYCDNGNVRCAVVDGVEVSTPAPVVCAGTTSLPPINDPPTRPTPPAPRQCRHDLFLDFEEGTIRSQYRDDGRCSVYICEDLGFGPFARESIVSCINSLYSMCSNFTPLEEEVSRCCGFCTACNFTTCPVNNECVLQDAPGSNQAACVCSKGYSWGENNTCVDTDECTLGRRPLGHNCPGMSVCINTVGSFTCECNKGYLQELNNQGIRTCEDIDECREGPYMHNCNEFSTCVNKEGSFLCLCDRGYDNTGPDGACEPVCASPCENGGVCASPDTCTCPPEFTGPRCEKDLNECNYPNLNTCRGERKVCFNTVGGYFCRCEEGYQEGEDSKCNDVDECSTRINNCVGGAKCRNTPGSFRCFCKDIRFPNIADGPPVDCTGSCVRREIRYANLESYIDRDNCRNCTCLNGEITCRRVECDCSQPDVIQKCCPDCSASARNCYVRNQTISIRPGNSWVNPANRCERYDCNQGVTPVFVDLNASCPNLECPKDLQRVPVGKCCPVCMMPACDSSLEGRTVTLRNGCKQCTCENFNWSCMDKSICPKVECDPTDIVFYRDGCCPVCRHEVLGTNVSQCFTSL